MEMKKVTIVINILLIFTLILSTISVTADVNKQIIKNSIDIKQEIDPIYSGPIVWDNGMDYSGIMLAQWDEEKQFDFYLADDFKFDEETEVAQVQWIGGFWGEDYQSGDFDWCVSFFNNNGSEDKPLGQPQDPSLAGPYCYIWNDIEKEVINDTGTSILFKFSIDLPDVLTFDAYEKYWISIWAEGAYPPQSGLSYHKTFLLNSTVLGSDYFGFPFWTPGSDVQGFEFDIAFQLFAPLEPLPPTPPYIDGPREGPANTRLCWTFKSEDPNEDMLKYIIDWGDGTINETSYNLSDTPVEFCHIYEKKKLYTITAYAEDETGLKGNESTFGVSIPRGRNFFWYRNLQLFEKFQILFPILRHLF